MGSPPINPFLNSPLNSPNSGALVMDHGRDSGPNTQEFGPIRLVPSVDERMASIGLALQNLQLNLGFELSDELEPLPRERPLDPASRIVRMNAIADRLQQALGNEDDDEKSPTLEGIERGLEGIIAAESDDDIDDIKEVDERAIPLSEFHTPKRVQILNEDGAVYQSGISLLRPSPVRKTVVTSIFGKVLPQV